MMLEYLILLNSNSRQFEWHDSNSQRITNPMPYNAYIDLYDSMIFSKRVFATNVDFLNCFSTQMAPSSLAYVPFICNIGVSEELKQFLQKFNLPKHRFIKIQYTYNNSIFSDFYYLYWEDSIYNYIDFKSSEILFRSRNEQLNRNLNLLNISNYEEFYLAKMNGLVLFKSVNFISDAPLFDWFYIDNGAENNMVSKNLKEKLEKHEFTGFHFEASRVEWKI